MKIYYFSTVFEFVLLFLCINACVSLKSPSAYSRSRSYDWSALRASDPSRTETGVFNPMNFVINNNDRDEEVCPKNNKKSFVLPAATAAAGATIVTSSLVLPAPVTAVQIDLFDPRQFQPVCPASDGIYQLLKGTSTALVGQSNADEYGPLIASVLLRVRLELCVLESFVDEAVVPFIQKKGVSWVLPLHETVETFLAGTIFAIATNFILLSSTKIIAVLFVYADTLTGMPSRAVGSGIKKISKKSSGGEVFGTVLKTYGDVLGFTRSLIEQIDLFVGRYLVLATSAYIAFKFAHFKFFNDIF